MNDRIQLITCLLLLTTASAHAEINFAPSAQPAIVWTLDNPKSIGGLRPEILGTPQLIDVQDGGPALHFNGKSDGLLLSVNPLRGLNKFTIEVLFRPDTGGPSAQRFLHIQDEDNSRALIETRMVNPKSWSLDTFLHSGDVSHALLDRKKTHPTGKWTWVALVYDGRTMSDYVDGAKEMESRVNFTPMANGRISLGVRRNRVYWFKGSLKEIRFSPSALDPADLQRISPR